MSADASSDAKADAEAGTPACPYSGPQIGRQCENTNGIAVVCSATEKCCVDERVCKPRSVGSCLNGFQHECTGQSQCTSAEYCCMRVISWATPDSCPHRALFGGTRCGAFCQSDEVELCHSGSRPCASGKACEAVHTTIDFANDSFSIHMLDMGACR